MDVCALCADEAGILGLTQRGTAGTSVSSTDQRRVDTPCSWRIHPAGSGAEEEAIRTVCRWRSIPATGVRVATLAVDGVSKSLLAATLPYARRTVSTYPSLNTELDAFDPDTVGSDPSIQAGSAIGDRRIGAARIPIA